MIQTSKHFTTAKSLEENIKGFFKNFVFKSTNTGGSTITKYDSFHSEDDSFFLFGIFRGTDPIFEIKSHSDFFDLEGKKNGGSIMEIGFYIKNGIITDTFGKTENFKKIYEWSDDDLELLGNLSLDEKVKLLERIHINNFNNFPEFVIDKLIEIDYFNKFYIEEDRIKISQNLNNDKIFPQAIIDIFLF